MNLKVGDRVSMSPVWKYQQKEGSVFKITKEYVVVKWDDTNGEWHYTLKQAENLKLISEEE
jgi:hypothetical protein